MRLRVRRLDEEDVVYVDGLLTMTPERTIADLVETREDPSLIADALRHAAEQWMPLHLSRLGQLLDPLASRNGQPSGVALAEKLMVVGGLDESGLLRRP
ncbi:hypothetical protein [Microbacterium gorillae]|uniref:hypothetical protein n=1 Tax=Microbacterium gorillae TaxID=1231063 RepID=UPI003D970C08